MKILLDTQVLFWWFNEPGKLSRRARSLVEDSENGILVSAATAWELAIKTTLGKIDALALVMELSALVAEEGFSELAITVDQATRAGLLPLHHRDPFDRLLVAQAQDVNAALLSTDRQLERYDIKRLW